MRMPFSPFFTLRQAGSMRTAPRRALHRPLSCDFEDIAKAVIVKAAHGVEVSRQRIAMTCLHCAISSLTLAAMISFAVCRCCGCLGFGVDWVTLLVVAMVFIGASSLALAVVFSCHAWHVPTCRTPPGEGGGSKAQWGGVSPTLAAQAKPERKGRSEAEVCTSAARKIGETPCAARLGQSPLAGLSTLLGAERRNYRGRALREGTARRGGWRRTRTRP